MEFGGYLIWKHYIEANIKNNFCTNAKIQGLCANFKISLCISNNSIRFLSHCIKLIKS